MTRLKRRADRHLGGPCVCGAPRVAGRPLCQPHLNRADYRLVKRYFDGVRRVRRNPGDASAVALLQQAIDELAAWAEANPL